MAYSEFVAAVKPETTWRSAEILVKSRIDQCMPLPFRVLGGCIAPPRELALDYFSHTLSVLQLTPWSEYVNRCVYSHAPTHVTVPLINLSHKPHRPHTYAFVPWGQSRIVRLATCPGVPRPLPVRSVSRGTTGLRDVILYRVRYPRSAQFESRVSPCPKSFARGSLLARWLRTSVLE